MVRVITLTNMAESLLPGLIHDRCEHSLECKGSIHICVACLPWLVWGHGYICNIKTHLVPIYKLLVSLKVPSRPISSPCIRRRYAILINAHLDRNQEQPSIPFPNFLHRLHNPLDFISGSAPRFEAKASRTHHLLDTIPVKASNCTLVKVKGYETSRSADAEVS